MKDNSFEEQLRLLNHNGVPEAGALLEKLWELASERSYSNLDFLLRQFDVTEERRLRKRQGAMAAPMSRLQILKYYRMNGMWPRVRRVRTTNPKYPTLRGNMRRLREVRRLVGDYIY